MEEGGGTKAGRMGGTDPDWGEEEKGGEREDLEGDPGGREMSLDSLLIW